MIRQLSTLSMLALFAGCTPVAQKPDGPTYDSSQNPELLSPDLYSTGAKSGQDPMVRYGRYALVNTAPDAEQRDLMAQIIDVSIPANMHPSVQDAMQYVVSRSGYTLCPASTDHVNILFTRPLPAAQYKLGPMSLRNTLQVLAGPAWQVKVNEVTRGVCFVLRPGYQMPDTPRPTAPATQPVQQAIAASASPGPSSTPVTVLTVSDSAPPITKGSSLPAQTGTTSGSPTQSSSTAQPIKTISPPAKEGTPLPQNAAPVANTPSKTTPGSSVNAVANIGRSNTTPTTQPSPVKPVVPPVAQESWSAPADSTLRQSIEAWAKRADWRVIWEPDDLDYPIEASLRFTGSFIEAIYQIFPLYDNAKRSFVVDGNSAQRILHVSERKK